MRGECSASTALHWELRRCAPRCAAARPPLPPSAPPSLLRPLHPMSALRHHQLRRHHLRHNPPFIRMIALRQHHLRHHCPSSSACLLCATTSCAISRPLHPHVCALLLGVKGRKNATDGRTDGLPLIKPRPQGPAGRSQGYSKGEVDVPAS